MNKISADTIDNIAEGLNLHSPEQIEKMLNDFGNEQPVALSYLMQEDFEAMGDNEHELMLFTALQIWFIMKTELNTLKTPEAADIDDAQDNNWKDIENLPAQKSRSFEEYIEPIIAKYAQSELMYFVIDTFEEDEGDEFSMNKESRLPIFLALKTLVDVWG